MPVSEKKKTFSKCFFFFLANKKTETETEGHAREKKRLPERLTKFVPTLCQIT